MSLDVHITPDISEEGEVQERIEDDKEKNNNTTTWIPSGPKHPIPISSHE